MYPLCPSDISTAQRGKPAPLSPLFTITLASPIEGEGDRRLPRASGYPVCAGMTVEMRV